MATLQLKLGLLCLILLNSTVIASKLNVPRILLPIFSDFSTKFTLEAVEGGCYKWTTTRSDIISLTPVDVNKELECSSKVLVSTISKEENRNLAVVLAEDVNTAQMLKCDVIVDVIHSLSVTTSTRELFMEEVPEAFQLNAYDDQGNEFSTLEGIEFDWSIVSMTPGKDALVVRYLPFKDSPYETPPHIEELEDENKKGSVILLEGVKTGSAKVVVRLPYAEYRHVQPLEILLTVVANILITPAEVYIMAGDIVTVKVFYMHSGRMDEIYLPDPLYNFQSDDPEIAATDKFSSEVTALKIGRTRVVLHNTNMNESDPSLKLPAATINVVEPAYFTINLLPHKNWAILVGDEHEILVEVFSNSDHKLYLGPGVEIATRLGDAFHVEERSKDGSSIKGWGLRESRVTIKASLDAVLHRTKGKFPFKQAITGQAELYIYPRITISPSEVILPWDPQIKPKYDVDLVAKGGDGRFLWTSTDHTVGVVTQTGHVRTMSQGFFEVSAAMFRNHHNRQSAKFSILPPARLEIVEFVMEAEIGTAIYLHIALYADKPGPGSKSSYIPFTQCQNLPFQIRQSDNKFAHNKSDVIPPIGVSCANIAMVGVSVGTSKVTVSYYQDGLLLEDSVTISAYNPLLLVQPENEVVLAVGSSVNLLYTGGPRPLIGRLSDHQRIVISQNDAVIQAEDVTEAHVLPDDDYTVVWVLCRKLGENSVKLMISNTPTLPNCKTRVSTLVTKIICGKPRMIHLQPEIQVADPQSCPMDLSADRVVVPNDQNITLNVMILDEVGRLFLNTSTLLLKWEATPAAKSHTIKFHDKDGSIPNNLTFGSVVIANKSQQVISTPQDVGLIEVTVTVVSYKSGKLKYYHITPEWPEFVTGEERVGEMPVIQTKIGLYLVDGTIVKPNFTVIFNQPDKKKIISVLHGSGYVELSLSADDIASVTYVEGAREIEIIPTRSGEFTIQLNDLCLISRPAFIDVKVVTIGSIFVEMPEKVQVNHCIHVVVKLYDETEELMQINNIGEINLNHRFTENIANLGPMPASEADPWPPGEVHFVLTGVELGDTELSFSFDNGDRRVTSAPVPLQVFPPLKLYPRNGTLLVGSTLQLTIKGGPQPDCNLEFVAVTNKTAEVSDMGIVVGRALGTTKITAKSIGIHPRTGEKIVYSEDAVEVHVIKIRGVKIACPLTKFKVGSTVPAWIVGIPEQLSPLTLGTFEDSSIQFDWKLGENDVATINSVFDTVGVFYKNTDRIAIRITGLQEGTTRLSVNVSINGLAAGTKHEMPTVRFYSFLDLEVFTAFTLTDPQGLSGESLLLAQYSSIQLATNLDGLASITYSLPGEDEVIETSKDKNGAVTTDVINPIVTVSETGLLQAYSTVGYSILVMTATDEFGVKQTRNYVVEVKPVHYMMLTVIASWRIHLDSSLRVLPLGTEFELMPLFYDNMGNKFHAGPPEVKMRANRLDLIKMKQSPQNGSIIVSSKKGGHTVVKAWTDGTDKTADYVRIHAEEVIHPVVEALTSGDILCLWSPVVTKNLQMGLWTSSDTDLITIDPILDIAYVTGHREGSVFITNPLHPSAPMFVHILPVAKVVLRPDPDLVVTNGLEAIFRVPLVLLNRIGPENKQSNLIQGWLCDRNFAKQIVPTPFTCHIAFRNESVVMSADTVFLMKSSFAPRIGQYNCKFWVAAANTPEIAVLETDVTVWAVATSGEVEAEPLHLVFLPNVYADPEVRIEDDTGVGDLEIIGLEKVLAQVTVEPADSSIVYVDSGHLVGPNMLKFRVQLVDYHWKLAGSEEAMGIVINSPLTDQVLRVMVAVSDRMGEGRCMGQSPITQFLQVYRHTIIIVVSMLVIFFVSCYVYSRYMQPVVNVNVHPNRSLYLNQTGQRSPLAGPSSPSGFNRSSAGGSPLSQPPISRLSPASHICTNKFNCSCGQVPNREPVYGDASTFTVNSPELRRNRRFL